MASMYKNVVVRFPNWLGDAVMATPLLQKIKMRFPDAKVTALCQGGVGKLLMHHPYVDEVISFAHNDKYAAHQALKKKEFDLGILLPNSFSSAFFLWRARVKKRVGYKADKRSLFLTDPIPFSKEREKEHLVITYQRLLTPLGIEVDETKPLLVVSEEEKERAKALLQEKGVDLSHTLMGINPGAAYGSAKCWLPDRFNAVALRLLQNPHVTVLLFGDEAGASLTQEICKGLGPRAIDLAGKTSLRDLIACISLCDRFLTNDSGPMHIAAALQIPLVALFGSTNDTTTGPYQHGTVIHKHVECSPCYLRTCPIDFRCMKRIEADEVYKKVSGGL